MQLSSQLASFRGAVHTLCQPAGDRTSRTAAETFLDSLKYTEEGWQTLLAVLSADTWNTWTAEERLVAASQLFSASCKGKSLTSVLLSQICPILATSLKAAHETRDLSTAGFINRTLISLLIRSLEIREQDLIPALLQLVADGECSSILQNDIMLRLLSCVPEVVTLSSISMHPMRRQSIITALTTDSFLTNNNTTNSSSTAQNNGNNFFSAASPLVTLVTFPLQPHVQAYESTQEAALNVVHAWCLYLGCVPPVELDENNIKFIHSLAAQCGSGSGGSGNSGLVCQNNSVNNGRGVASAAVETIAALYATCSTGEKQESEKKLGQRDEKAAKAAAAVLLPMLLNCLPELLTAFSATITATTSPPPSSSQAEAALAAAVTILGAATAAAASAPPDIIAYETTSTFLAQSLLSLLRHPDPDTRIATLAVFDTWLSTPLEQNSKESKFEKSAQGCFPSVEALAALLQQLVSCVNLQGLPASVLTADARDLPEEAQMIRRETTDSIKLVVAALSPSNAACLLLKLAEDAHKQGDMLQLEACLYVANLIPKNSLFSGKRIPEIEGKEEANAPACYQNKNINTNKDQDFDILENLLRLGTVSILPTAPKLAGTALTLLGGLGPVLGEILSPKFSEICIEPCWTAFSQTFNTIISTILNCEISDPKLARNAATTVFRLASVHFLARHISVTLPAAIEALYHCYINNQASSQGSTAAEITKITSLHHSLNSEKYPNDITTREFVLKSLCLLGGSQAQQMLLVEHARKAEEALTPTCFLPSVVTLHLKSVAIILEIAKQESGPGEEREKAGGFELGEVGTQISQLLLHVATTTASATVPSKLNNKEHVSGAKETELEILSSALLDCSGSLAALCPNTVDVCIQIIGFLAVFDLAGALHALSSIISAEFSSSPSSTLTQNGVIAVSIDIAEKVFEACDHPKSQDESSDASFVALLKYFQVFLSQQHHQQQQQWPTTGASSAWSSLEHVILMALSAASQSWNRDICEASLTLASELLTTAYSSNADVNANGNAPTPSTLTTAVLSFLLAASCGGQPPYMLPSIADIVYSTWIHTKSNKNLNGGSNNDKEAFFFNNFTAAMAAPMTLPGGATAPWFSWTQETLSTYLNDLFSESSRNDGKRFKKVYKALCGGKKKGVVGRPPARQF